MRAVSTGPRVQGQRRPCAFWRPTARPPSGLLCCSIIRESAWQLELKGDVTRQRRLEAVDKLMSVLTLVVAAVFGVQALGLDVNSGGWTGRLWAGRCWPPPGLAV